MDEILTIDPLPLPYNVNEKIFISIDEYTEMKEYE